MSIATITTSRHTIELAHPFVTALRRVDAVHFVRVVISDEHGFSGIGEAPPTVAITGEDMQSIEEDINKHIAPLLRHQKLDARIFETLHVSHAKSSAKAAVDMALYNLLAARERHDLVTYLGGKRRTLRTAITISLGTPETMAQHAKAACEKGYDILKIKVGGKDGHDIARIQAIRAVTGNATLLIDANQAWSEDEALHTIEAITPLDIALIEQPLNADALEAMARLTCKSPIPILADESAFDIEGVQRVYEMRSADMINIKLMKCGGISKAIEILEFCRAHKLTCMMGSMLEGPHSIKAAAELAMCYGDVIRYVDLDSPLLYADSAMAAPLRYEKAVLLP